MYGSQPPRQPHNEPYILASRHLCSTFLHSTKVESDGISHLKIDYKRLKHSSWAPPTTHSLIFSLTPTSLSLPDTPFGKRLFQWRDPCGKKLKTSANSHMNELGSRSSNPCQVFRDRSPGQQLTCNLMRDLELELLTTNYSQTTPRFLIHRNYMT